MRSVEIVLALVALATVVAALAERMRIPLAVAFVLGGVLASTDAVAVTALGRRLRLPTRLATVVQAESLFNDGTSLVLFSVAQRLRAGLQDRVDRTRDRPPGSSSIDPGGEDLRQVQRALLDAESAELQRMHASGEITDAVQRRLQRQLDLEETRLRS